MARLGQSNPLHGSKRYPVMFSQIINQMKKMNENEFFFVKNHAAAVRIPHWISYNFQIKQKEHFFFSAI